MTQQKPLSIESKTLLASVIFRASLEYSLDRMCPNPHKGLQVLRIDVAKIRHVAL